MTFLSEKITVGEAAVQALVGFCIVLAVLALLVGIFYLSGFIFKSKLFDGKSKPSTKTAIPDTADGTDDEELVAAITAAISVMLAEETGNDDPGFVIRRITRK